MLFCYFRSLECLVCLKQIPVLQKLPNVIELQHDKTNKMTCQVWSESLLCALWVDKDPMFLHADRKDSDQTGRMPRLIWVFTGRTCHFVSFVKLRLNYLLCRCNHRNNCTIWATNTLYGDPCPNTFKYLMITYFCQRQGKVCYHGNAWSLW